MNEIIGWKLQQNHVLHYKAQSGTPLIEVKGHLFPNYNQRVRLLNHTPTIKQKTKKNNSFWFFSNKSKRRGVIDFLFNFESNQFRIPKSIREFPPRLLNGAF